MTRALFLLIWVLTAGITPTQTKSERAVAIVLAAGAGAKCDGKPLKRGDVIMPGQRVTTGKGWAHLMTKKWGECSLRQRHSWPPLNAPRVIAGAEKLFAGVVALFKRQQVAWNAGTKTGTRPEQFDLIGIASEVANPSSPTDATVRVAYAVLPGRAHQVQATTDSGAKLTFTSNRRIGALGDHDIYICEVIARPAGNSGFLSLSTLKAGDRISPLSFAMKPSGMSSDDKDAFTQLKGRFEAVQGLSELMSVGYLLESLASTPDATKFSSFCPVRAFESYLRVYVQTKSDADRRLAKVALFHELERRGCPLECYVAPDS